MSSLLPQTERRWIETEYVSSGCTNGGEVNHATSTDTAAAAAAEDDDEDDDDHPGLFSMFADTELETTEHRFPNPINSPSSSSSSSSSNDEELVVKLQSLHPSTGQTLSSTGLTLWRAAPQLCTYLLSQQSLIQGRRVIELGAGVGLVGILASYLAPSEIYLTDGDTDTLKGMRHNISLNYEQGVPDFLKTKQLIWSEETTKAFVVEEGRFDTILGSDIIYVPQIVPLLFETVDLILKPYTDDGNQQPAFVLSYARRNVKMDDVLAESQKYGFKIEESKDSEGCWIFTRQKE
jgi:predicted nicotinamide N-methyase